MKRLKSLLSKRILILLIPFTILSSNAVILKYSYDDSGNRISRYRKTNKVASPAKKNIPEQKNELTNSIKVYPNPTKGPLNIDILSFSNEDNIHVTIYTLKGEFISDHTLNQPITMLDLSTMSNGWYIVTVTINDKSENWKILKN